MNYKEFDNTQLHSPIELHKTDYNNYADLSHFIEQYNIAQQIIKECGEFYKSFLISKLLTWNQILNCSYRDKIDFTEIIVDKKQYDYHSYYDDETVYNRFIEIYVEYLNDEKDEFWIYNDEELDLKVVDVVKTQKEIKKLKAEQNAIGMNLAISVQNYIPTEICEEYGCFYTLKSSSKVTKKNYEHWISVVKRLSDSILSVRKNLEIGNNIIEWARKQHDDVVVKLDEFDKKIEYLENCIIYTKNKNKRNLAQDFLDKLNTLFIPKKCCRIPSSVDNLYNFGFKLNEYLIDESGKVIKSPVISKNDFSSLMKEIEDYIITKVRENKLEKIFTNIKDYYVIVDGTLQKFSANLKGVNIQLSDNQKELVCTDIYVTERKAYRWPSDAPTIRTTKTTTLKFNTETNEVLSYNVDCDDEEIKCKWANY